MHATPQTWDLPRAMGRAAVALQTTTEAMLDRVASGESWLAYNVITSYARERARRDPALEVTFRRL